MNDELDKLLRGIEYPGEDEEAIRAYLEERQFVDRVMARVYLAAHPYRKAYLWGLFSAINLALLALMGINPFILTEFFALQNALAQFFFLFLGLSFLGGLVGLVMSLDTSWLRHFLHRDA